MINQPMPYPPKPRRRYYAAHSWARSFGWVAFGLLSMLCMTFMIFFYHASWLAECAR